MSEQLLPSWSEGLARQAVLDYVHGATTPGETFVEPADRIATFDNDGTLWVEQPLPPQFDFVFRTWEEEVKADPSLARRQPYQALMERDQRFFEGLATQEPEAVTSLLEAFARSWAGTTPEEFDAQVGDWTRTVRDPRFGVPYVELVYQPMLELFDLLRDNGFRVFVCSGGGRDFMRVFAEDIWGIPKENVIGSAATYAYTDGKIIRSNELLGGLDLGPGKPEHIFAHTGRLPAFAGGNADVDIEMLKSAAFALLVRHDDEQREYAYTTGAETSLTTAEQLGWTIVSMKNDWTTLF
ncbi:HAD family hydrolase [Streptomyces aureus]|uniref:HAD family hydrolase n=1 Tax=Streptomyces aureus TaxID=193461 RepID=UPI0033F2CD6E